MLEADYVIVGGGSAGCVLASRLSEDPKTTVILLEAGQASDTLLVNMPNGSVKLMGRPERDWMHLTEPDPSLNGRQILWIAGKMLGGGSAINGTIYIRGDKADYDGWAANGCTGWSWDEVLPLFKRSERFAGPPSPSHGRDGPLGVSPIRTPHPLTAAFVEACAATGQRRIADYCAGDVDGTFENLFTQWQGRRSSTAKAFLDPAARRANLTVLTGVVADRVLFDADRRAAGVAFHERDGVARQVRARREVILSAGTIQSPALLMRSGIGPAAHLSDMAVDVLVDAPEVGRNLQEHASVPSSRFVDVPTLNSMATLWRMPFHAAHYLLFGRGLLTSPPVQAMGFLRSRPDLAHPDIKLQFGPICIDTRTRTPHSRAGVTVFVNVSPPKSPGEIRLRSTDPRDNPIIDHRHLGAAEDIAAFISGMKQVERIYEAPPLARHVTGRCLPEPAPTSDAGWEDYLRAHAVIGFHPVGSCRMGGDAQSVVDPALKVRGVSRLRVADASIIPVMPSANTNAPVIMVGEKGADLIRRDAT